MKQSIAIITQDYKPATGGIAVYWHELFSRLPHNKYTLIAPSAAEADDGLDVMRIPFFYKLMWPHWLRLLFTLVRLQRKEHFMHMIAGQVLPVGTVLFIGKSLGMLPSYSVSCHSMDISHISGWKRGLAKLILSSASRVIVNSNYTKNIAVDEYGISDTKVHAVTPAPSHVPSTSEVVADKNVLTLLSVGRLVKRKGVDTVISILPDLYAEFPDLRYVIVGEGKDKKYLQSLVDNYIPQDKRSQVVFTGRLSDKDLLDYYRDASIFVLPSRNIKGDVEGFGIVNLEASAYGLPVVVGKDGGVPETVIHNDTGVLVDGNNKQEVKDVILDLLKNSSKRSAMGNRGRQYALDFSWDKSASKLDSIYDINNSSNI
ncbi:MAG: glycosyltransferase family 4 protein [Patescibacteria group bacterium]